MGAIMVITSEFNALLSLTRSIIIEEVKVTSSSRRKEERSRVGIFISGDHWDCRILL